MKHDVHVEDILIHLITLWCFPVRVREKNAKKLRGLEQGKEKDGLCVHPRAEHL